MIRRIDCHQHFWRYSPQQHAWITDDMMSLRRDFLPADLQPLLQHSHQQACIAVQAASSLDETRFLLQLADAHAWIAGVVGWVDLQADDVEAQLQEFVDHPAFVGVRHIAQSEPEGFLLRPALRRGLQALARHGLTFDLLVYPHQLREATELVASMPAQTFVLDHLAKPYVARGEREPWARELAQLARSPNVSCKLSGLVTEANWRQWTPAALRPYFAAALDAFGPERLLFGSDWPVCTVACSYQRWSDIVGSWIAPLPGPLQQAILGGNAIRVYGAIRDCGAIRDYGLGDVPD